MRKPLYNECWCPWLCVRVRDAAAMMIDKQSCLLAESVSMATHHISRQRGSAWTSFQCHQLQRPSHFLRRRRPSQTHRRHRLRSEPASKGCPLWVGTCTWNRSRCQHWSACGTHRGRPNVPGESEEHKRRDLREEGAQPRLQHRAREATPATHVHTPHLRTSLYVSAISTR